MIVIIDYDAGNIRSVQNALQRLNAEAVLSNNIDEILAADRVILPGVGSAGRAMDSLRQKKLDKIIPGLKQPVLGICLGMQLLCSYSEEQDTECLKVFNTRIKKFPSKDIIPHMGWNEISKLKSPLMRGIPEGSNQYFVHSYYAESCSQSIGDCNYILPFAAALEKENFYATQFHPEKSSKEGSRILKNFLEL